MLWNNMYIKFLTWHKTIVGHSDGALIIPVFGRLRQEFKVNLGNLFRAQHPGSPEPHKPQIDVCIPRT